MQRQTLMYDGSFEGPRWTYGLSLRPLGYAQVPDGWIIGSDREHPHYRYGTVQYPFPLDAAVARQMDLEPVEQGAALSAPPTPLHGQEVSGDR